MTDRRGQIADTIRQRIVSGLRLGTLRPGTRLPNTREPAEEFDVAPRDRHVRVPAAPRGGAGGASRAIGIYVAPGESGDSLGDTRRRRRPTSRAGRTGCWATTRWRSA